MCVYVCMCVCMHVHTYACIGCMYVHAYCVLAKPPIRPRHMAKNKNMFFLHRERGHQRLPLVTNFYFFFTRDIFEFIFYFPM